MASGMKKWLGLVAGGLGLIALWALPPRSLEDWLGWARDPGEDPSPESLAFSRIGREARQLGDLYQYLVWGDSIEALARSSLEGNIRWAVAVPGFTPAEGREALESAVRRQVTALGVPAPAVPVGAAVMDAEFGLYPGVPWHFGNAGRGMIFVGLDPENAFCFVVRSEPVGAAPSASALLAWAGPDSADLPNPLGPCAWHARYGTPGEGISEWLGKGGYRYAEDPWGPGAGASYRLEAPELRRIGVRTLPRLSTDGVACASGSREGCRGALLAATGFEEVGASTLGIGEDRHPSRSLRAFRMRSSPWGMTFGGAGRTVLSDLEAEFGSERFRRFWTSDQDVMEAFEEAFGLPFEDWLLGWARVRWGDADVGPTVPIQAGLLTFLTAGLLAGGALMVDRRGRR